MDDEPRVRQFETAKATRPYWLRAINTLGALAPAAPRLDAESWLELARRRAGSLSDGEIDGTVEEGLFALVQALRESARLNLVGRISARDDTVRLLVNHLHVKETLASLPEIQHTSLPSPVFIIGLPRTGSTFLHHLMSCDPDNRTMPYWESYTPVPPRSGDDDRPAAVTRMLNQMDHVSPGYQAIHPMAADSPEECVALFMNVLRTRQLDIQYRVPGYVDWLTGQDAAIAYHAYREQLQLVQHFRPAGRRFILKDPTHVFHVPTILQAFPDARFVFIHRSPEKTVSSICSLYAHTRAIFSDHVDPAEVGREIASGYWLRGIDVMLEARAALSDERYTDIRQPDLNAAPIETLRSAYDALGISLTAGAHRAMERFIETELAMFRHAHEHSLEGFGLEPAEVREQTRGYIEQFDL